MTKCQHCERKTDQFLCSTCTNELRDMLTELPQWVEWLGDTALGHTRSGHTERRSKGETRLLFEPDTESGRRTRQERASELFAQIHNTLGTIVRDLCATRGVEFKPVRIVDPKFIGPLRRNRIRGDYTGKHATACWWLAYHVSAIAMDESAGHIFKEVANMRSIVERIVNPSSPPRWIGVCPTWLEEKQDWCGRDLEARDDAIEVNCRKCRRTHRVERVQLHMATTLEHERLTIEEIRAYMRRALAPDEQISERTLRHWRAKDKLKPCGWKRADNGRRGIAKHSDDDEPLYTWADITKLRSENRKVKA